VKTRRNAFASGAANLGIKVGSTTTMEAHRFTHPRLTKRLLDLIVAIPLLHVMAPILLLPVMLVHLTNPGTLLFREVRIGQGGQPFTILKLRTMYMGNGDRAFREFNTQELLGNANPNSEGTFRVGNDVRVLCRRGFPPPL
jgi:lipopolysaccharide/colanic/teichoic acid biosynthesis glycosyltransferase